MGVDGEKKQRGEWMIKKGRRGGKARTGGGRGDAQVRSLASGRRKKVHAVRMPPIPSQNHAI